MCGRPCHPARCTGSSECPASPMAKTPSKGGARYRRLVSGLLGPQGGSAFPLRWQVWILPCCLAAWAGGETHSERQDQRRAADSRRGHQGERCAWLSVVWAGAEVCEGGRGPLPRGRKGNGLLGYRRAGGVGVAFCLAGGGGEKPRDAVAIGPPAQGFSDRSPRHRSKVGCVGPGLGAAWLLPCSSLRGVAAPSSSRGGGPRRCGASPGPLWQEGPSVSYCVAAE